MYLIDKHTFYSRASFRARPALIVPGITVQIYYRRKNSRAVRLGGIFGLEDEFYLSYPVVVIDVCGGAVEINRSPWSTSTTLFSLNTKLLLGLYGKEWFARLVD